MLQTPPVTKMTPKKRISTPKGITPQSILKVKNLITATSPSPSSQNITPNSQGKPKIPCPTLTFKTPKVTTRPSILKGKKLMFISPKGHNHNSTIYSQG